MSFNEVEQFLQNRSLRELIHLEEVVKDKIQTLQMRRKQEQTVSTTSTESIAEQQCDLTKDTPTIATKFVAISHRELSKLVVRSRYHLRILTVQLWRVKPKKCSNTEKKLPDAALHSIQMHQIITATAAMTIRRLKLHVLQFIQPKIRFVTMGHPDAKLSGPPKR